MSYDTVTVTTNGWYGFDIAVLTQGWVDETVENYGVIFYGTAAGSFWQIFYSKEASMNHPYLEIEYTPVGVESASLGGIKAAFK
jgi:hypothetical protein